jgi:uncharacterized protein (DUF4415 family)
MSGSKRELGSDLAKLDATTDEEIARQIADDPDTAPELSDEQLHRADLYENERFNRPVGRPKGSGTKELITLRIDREVLDRFRSTGPVAGLASTTSCARSLVMKSSLEFGQLRSALG